jgi:hypothetical protein
MATGRAEVEHGRGAEAGKAKREGRGEEKKGNEIFLSMLDTRRG